MKTLFLTLTLLVSAAQANTFDNKKINAEAVYNTLKVQETAANGGINGSRAVKSVGGLQCSSTRLILRGSTKSSYSCQTAENVDHRSVYYALNVRAEKAAGGSLGSASVYAKTVGGLMCIMRLQPNQDPQYSCNL